MSMPFLASEPFLASDTDLEMPQSDTVLTPLGERCSFASLDGNTPYGRVLYRSSGGPPVSPPCGPLQLLDFEPKAPGKTARELLLPGILSPVGCIVTLPVIILCFINLLSSFLSIILGIVDIGSVSLAVVPQLHIFSQRNHYFLPTGMALINADEERVGSVKILATTSSYLQTRAPAQVSLTPTVEKFLKVGGHSSRLYAPGYARIAAQQTRTNEETLEYISSGSSSTTTCNPNPSASSN